MFYSFLILSCSVNTQFSMNKQSNGVTTPSSAHLSSSGQVIHGMFSIESTLTGNFTGVNLYVHLPPSKSFCLSTILLFSNFIANREPSLLLKPNFFQRSQCNIPTHPLSITIS